MDVQIVQDHHIATPEAWCELRADIAIENGTIHGSLDDQGATSSSQRKPAMKVCVRHLPKGASAMSRSPFRPRPRKGVMLVFTLVSSMKTSRAGWRRMNGWRRSYHVRRAALTSARSFSDASSVFFIGKPVPAQKLGQVRWIGGMGL